MWVRKFTQSSFCLSLLWLLFSMWSLYVHKPSASAKDMVIVEGLSSFAGKCAALSRCVAFSLLPGSCGYLTHSLCLSYSPDLTGKFLVGIFLLAPPRMQLQFPATLVFSFCLPVKFLHVGFSMSHSKSVLFVSETLGFHGFPHTDRNIEHVEVGLSGAKQLQPQMKILLLPES